MADNREPVSILPAIIIFVFMFLTALALVDSCLGKVRTSASAGQNSSGSACPVKPLLDFVR